MYMFKCIETTHANNEVVVIGTIQVAADIKRRLFVVTFDRRLIIDINKIVSFLRRQRCHF